jgi:hypothetical protein
VVCNYCDGFKEIPGSDLAELMKSVYKTTTLVSVTRTVVTTTTKSDLPMQILQVFI